MAKQHYSMEEIIFGLRSAYIQQYRELAQLKKYVVTCDKRVQDYSFRLFQPCEHKPNLYLDFEVKENELKRWLYLFLLKFGWDTKCYGKNTSKVLRDFNDEFTLDGFYNAYISNDPKFAAEVKAIMESEFAQNIKTQLSNPHLGIEHNYLYISEPVVTNLWYYPRRDVLSLYDENFGGLSEALAVQVPKGDLPEYHQNQIDRYLKNKKEVFIDSVMPIGRITDYKIEETEDVFALRRIK